MRVTVGLASAMALLAASSGLAATATHFVVAKPGEAAKLCGPKPAKPGDWRCVGQSDRHETTQVQRSFQAITYTWVQGGKAMQDSWDAK